MIEYMLDNWLAIIFISLYALGWFYLLSRITMTGALKELNDFLEKKVNEYLKNKVKNEKKS